MKKKVIKKLIHQMIPMEYWWVNKILIRLLESAGNEALRALFRRMTVKNNKRKDGKYYDRYNCK